MAMALNLSAARLGHMWRLSMTGLGFLGFSVGGVVLSFVLFPAVNLYARSAQTRQRHAQWLIHKSFGLLVAMLTSTGVMRMQIHGAERLRSPGGVVVLANHPCLLDIVVLLSMLPRACCVVKDELWTHPVVGCIVRSAGYIGNATPEQVIEHASGILSHDVPLVIFPEGTRTRPGAPLRFQRGAAHISLASKKPILPILITCNPPTLLKGERWYDIPAQPFEITINIRPPVHADDLATFAPDRSLAARQLTQALQHYFDQELSAK